MLVLFSPAVQRTTLLLLSPLPGLPCAGDAARKRVLELEEENRRQKVALKARSNEAAAAQRQLRELTSRVRCWKSGQHDVDLLASINMPKNDTYSPCHACASATILLLHEMLALLQTGVTGAQQARLLSQGLSQGFNPQIPAPVNIPQQLGECSSITQVCKVSLLRCISKGP